MTMTMWLWQCDYDNVTMTICMNMNMTMTIWLWQYSAGATLSGWAVCVLCFRYVEQSNIFLEQRNESLQQSSSYSQSKMVELERDKVRRPADNMKKYEIKCVTNHEIAKKTNSKIITTNPRYHQRRCPEAWHIDSAHAPLNRNDGGLLPEAHLHLVNRWCHHRSLRV